MHGRRGRGGNDGTQLRIAGGGGELRGAPFRPFLSFFRIPPKPGAPAGEALSEGRVSGRLHEIATDGPCPA
jgi:hypothetical protein